ncbi:lipid-A-disaccharide synthase [Methylobrevis pamukkalensis]|uniref:Lipid-A-disaccharide synthase n=1 Tax=Methylobrevis pamukkalensis TaxID=1439726 RepID=A0A1E3H5S6_9HYPH|nr:lipid-A-disaccharide synthase [Methylobrevis pamukkalensis]ODN71156.1 Lipid-A-disaccharide synthase [Methylobrevis pamukkalensis]
MTAPLKVFVVVGEESGDQLGAGLVAGLRRRLGEGGVVFSGLAGHRMIGLGLSSLFPLADISVMGISAVLARLPTIVRRVHQTVDAALAAEPDVVVIIDSPDFTHAVARRIRKKRPQIPVVDYVSPSVWAWRPGRARKMTAYVDHLLAILPFEPEVHRRLGGPPCTYVGHPLAERLDLARTEALGETPADERPVLVVLPGSRRSEVSRLMAPFAETLSELAARGHEFRAVLPAVGHLEHEIRAAVATWPVQPEIMVGEAAKFAAFRSARAALAASGTVTLELALSGVPMIVTYKLDWFYRRFRDLTRIFPRLAYVHSMVLTNIILGENIVPEFLEDGVTGPNLADHVAPLLDLSDPARRRQVEAFGRLRAAMALPEGRHPSDLAAEVVIDVARRGRPHAGA